MEKLNIFGYLNNHEKVSHEEAYASQNYRFSNVLVCSEILVPDGGIDEGVMSLSNASVAVLSAL